MYQSHDLRKKDNAIVTAYWSVVGAASAAVASLAPVLAATNTANKSDDIFANAGSLMNDIYGKLFGLTTMVAVLAATVALLLRMFSSNQKTVDTATQWLKRIIVCWILINSMAFIVTYLGKYFNNSGRYIYNGT